MRKEEINVGDVVIFSEGTVDENHLFEGVVVKTTGFFIKYCHVLYLKDGREQINEFYAKSLYFKNKVDELKKVLKE